MVRRLFSLLALLFAVSALHAQSEAPSAPKPHYLLYGGYTWISNSWNGLPGDHHPLNGWDASLAFPDWHNLRFKIDTFRYSGTNLGAPQHGLFILGGGQYSVRVRRESIFVEGMFGTGGLNKNWGPNQTTGNTASAAALVGGGVDTAITRRLAFRVKADYQYSYFSLVNTLNIPYRVSGLPTNFAHISSGLVLNFW